MESIFKGVLNMKPNLVDIYSAISDTFKELKIILEAEYFFSGQFNFALKNQYEIIFNLSKANLLHMDQDLIYDTIYSDLYNDPPYENVDSILGYGSFDEDYDFHIKVREIYNEYEAKLLELVTKIGYDKGWGKLENGNFLDFVNADFCNFLHFFSYQKWANKNTTCYFLMEQINAYKLGGFPCAWKGMYPKGKLVVCIPCYGQRLVLIKKILFILLNSKPVRVDTVSAA